MKIFVIFISLLIISGYLFFVYKFLEHNEKYHKFQVYNNPNAAHVDFQTFHSWYSSNPQRYRLYAYCFSVDTSTPFCSDREMVYFTTYKEWIKYSKFFAVYGMQNSETNSQKSLSKILKIIQPEIDKYGMDTFTGSDK